MRIVFDRSTMLEKVIIEAGEYHTAASERLIQTVLGSCVAVCLRDEEADVSGMNHFMLPESVAPERVLVSDAGRYGIHSMELLVNEMIVRGARRDRLWAKVFGGGASVQIQTSGPSVAECNVAFADDFLRLENIPIKARDTGGRGGRKITFHTKTGEVLVQRLNASAGRGVSDIENSFRASMKSRRKRSEVTIFDTKGGRG